MPADLTIPRERAIHRDEVQNAAPFLDEVKAYHDEEEAELVGTTAVCPEMV